MVTEQIQQHPGIGQHVVLGAEDTLRMRALVAG